MGNGTCARSGTEQERSVCPALSGKDQPDKPMVKPGGGQRKSDGVVVPLGGSGQHNPVRGKDPDFDHACDAGTCKGMAGTARSNNPRSQQAAVVDLNRLPPVGDDVRRLQRTLWAAAKQSSDRRFHALFDRICRRDVLQRAYAGEPHVRIERGMGKHGRTAVRAPLTTNEAYTDPHRRCDGRRFGDGSSSLRHVEGRAHWCTMPVSAVR